MNLTEYVEINNLLQTFNAKIQAILGNRLVGVYLYGSLVWGDFDYDISDIDLLVVTTMDVNGNDFTNLDVLHNDLIKAFKDWENRIEIAYISQSALKTFKTQTSKIAVISPGEAFNTKDAGTDWLLNCYFIREKNIPLFGPDSRTIIEPITKDEFIAAVKKQALAWEDWITNTRNSRQYQSYAILTMSRALYALHNGEQASKKKAALWAQKKFPKWANLIKDALNWRADISDQPVDPLVTYPKIEKCVHEMVNYIKRDVCEKMTYKEL